MIIDPQSISYDTIKQDIIDYIDSLPDAAKWKDFFASSVGMTMVELVAGFGTYLAMKIVATRREVFLTSAMLKSSALAIGETLGYSASRGINYHMNLTVTSDSLVPQLFNKFDELGVYGNYSVYAAESFTLNASPATTNVEVIVGNLVSDITLQITSSDPQIFRFTEPNVSEDYELYLNDLLLPTSKYFKDLLNDKYLVLTNYVNSLDIVYLNNGYFVITSSNNTVIFGSNYSGGNVTLTISEGNYRGSELATEIARVMNDNATLTGGIIVFSVTYDTANRLFIVNAGLGLRVSFTRSGSTLALIIGFTVDKALAQIIESDTEATSPGSIMYRSGDTLKLKYIEYASMDQPNVNAINFDYGTVESGSVNTYQNPDTIEDIQVNAPLYHETQILVRSREDFKKVLKQLIPDAVDTNLIDDTLQVNPNAIVNVSYVKADQSLLTSSEKSEILTQLQSITPMGIPLPRNVGGTEPDIVDPTYATINLAITIKLLDTTTSTVTINEDITKILSDYELLLGITIDTDQIENDIERKSYIKTARITTTSTLELVWNQYAIINYTLTISS